MSGWFSVKHGITSHPLFKGRPERMAIWLWLLDHAAFQDTKHDINGKTVVVPRGAVAASERRIAEDVGVGYQVVRTFIARLKSEHMINAEVTHGKSVITLCNYEKYQSATGQANAAPNAPLTQGQRIKETREQQIGKTDTIVSVKKNQKRACQLPDGWVPSEENETYALEQGLSESEITHEAAQFRDYHVSRGSAFKDWNATWRTWCRNSIKWRAGRMAGGTNARENGQGNSFAAVAARRRLADQDAGHVSDRFPGV